MTGQLARNSVITSQRTENKTNHRERQRVYPGILWVELDSHKSKVAKPPNLIMNCVVAV
mgnify:CR=1 FL=1